MRGRSAEAERPYAAITIPRLRSCSRGEGGIAGQAARAWTMMYGFPPAHAICTGEEQAGHIVFSICTFSPPLCGGDVPKLYQEVISPSRVRDLPCVRRRVRL